MFSCLEIYFPKSPGNSALKSRKKGHLGDYKKSFFAVEEIGVF
jgi:hypothetical protein